MWITNDQPDKAGLTMRWKTIKNKKRNSNLVKKKQWLCKLVLDDSIFFLKKKLSVIDWNFFNYI